VRKPALWVLVFLGCHASSAADVRPGEWPSVDAPLRVIHAETPPSFGVHRVIVDAGHGALNNHGNTSCRCVLEQDFTLKAAKELAARLSATGHYEVKLARPTQAVVPYDARLEDAANWKAEAFVSLHSDVRGKVATWSPTAGATCPIHRGARGYSILYSDEGSDALVSPRRALARAIGRRLGDVGFPAYGGSFYQNDYEHDRAVPGVFLDRHQPDHRIFVLRHATVPLVIVETHHALDPDEADRWDEPKTLDAFASAIDAALIDVLQ
jgi:N-acetylmuramoyl-L-alanine amidase